MQRRQSFPDFLCQILGETKLEVFVLEVSWKKFCQNPTEEFQNRAFKQIIHTKNSKHIFGQNLNSLENCYFFLYGLHWNILTFRILLDKSLYLCSISNLLPERYWIYSIFSKLRKHYFKMSWMKTARHFFLTLFYHSIYVVTLSCGRLTSDSYQWVLQGSYKIIKTINLFFNYLMLMYKSFIIIIIIM